MTDIAIIGLDGKFPKANSLDKFWKSLIESKEGGTSFSDNTLKEEGIDPLEYQKPNYIKRKAILEDPFLFDANFFDFTPREAESIDPQHRLFLECCWNTFEYAGYDPGAYHGKISIFAGCSINSYFVHHCSQNKDYLKKNRPL